MAANLQKSIGYKYEIALFINGTQFQRILNAVRKIILQWALKLEEAGVTGDGMTFSADDQKAASHVTYNIQNYLHGKFDRSQIQVDTESSSQSIVVKPLDFKAIGVFLATLEQQAQALKLSAETQAELIVEIRTVEAQIKSPKPKGSIVRESLGVVSKILQGVATSALTTGLLYELHLKWSPFDGPQVDRVNESLGGRIWNVRVVVNTQRIIRPRPHRWPTVSG